MANNVFGNPITDATVKLLPRYIDKEIITATDRAQVALQYKNTEDKDTDAVTYVEKLKNSYGNGVSTLCLVYNATGDSLTFGGSHDWYGHIGDAPYPSRIENGQWGAYLHVHDSGAASGSVAAAVYRGKNADGDGCDWMFSWNNPWNRWFFNNTVYTEIREAHHYETDNWGYIYDKLKDCGLMNHDTWNGCYSTVTTGSSTSPKFEATLTLESAKKTILGNNY